MVTLHEAEQLLEKLSKSSLKVVPTHCVCVRNRNASCNACTTACPNHALTIENNQLLLDPDACTNCGSCANVCPTQALSSAALPHDAWLDLAQSLTNRRSPVWVCCQEHPLAQENLEHLLVIPCLAHLDEVHYLIMARYKISLHLLHGSCSSCKRGCVSPLIEKTFDSAQFLAKTYSLPFECTIQEEHNKETSSYPLTQDKGGFSRRGFFNSMTKSLKHLGYIAAESALEPALIPQKPQQTLAEKLTQAPGELKVFMPQRNTLLLNILFEAQQDHPALKTLCLETRFWGNVTIKSTCTNCGMCAQFCPTHALVHRVEEKAQTKPFPLFNSNQSLRPQKPQHKKAYHEFRCSDCIQCRLCEDVCLTKSLHVQRTILNSDLFNLEPRKLTPHDDKG